MGVATSSSYIATPQTINLLPCEVPPMEETSPSTSPTYIHPTRLRDALEVFHNKMFRLRKKGLVLKCVCVDGHLLNLF